MMKILQIPNYQYPHIGGIEQVARDIADALIGENEIQQKMICFNEDAQDDNYVCHRGETVYDRVDGVEVIRCGCIAKIASQSISLTYPRELRRVLESFRPDVVILHYPNPFVSSFLLQMIPKDTKFILYWHLDITKQKILGKLLQGQTKKLLERADQVVATSPHYIEGSPYLSKIKEKCVVIPNCVRTERLTITEKIRNKAEEIKTIYKGKMICFTVGRHVPYKGITYLVQASKYLDERFVVLIGGRGKLTENLKKEAETDSKVVFLGRITDEDLVSYLIACDIFAFPSITKNEAFGIALAEGMYFGNPAVTFTIPGSGVNYVNLDGVTGIECPNCDSKAFAGAIRKLAEDDVLREQYGKAAQKRVEGNFLFEQFKTDILALIKQMMV